MGLVKTRVDDRESARERSADFPFRTIIFGLQTKDGMTESRAWAWNPALEMWEYWAGDSMQRMKLFVLDDKKEVDTSHDMVCYVACVASTTNQDIFFGAKTANTFHAMAVATIGQENIAWTEELDELEKDILPFEDLEK